MSSDFLALILFILVLFLTPGPATLSLAASGAQNGFKGTLNYFLGIFTGLVLNLALVMFGLALVFTDYPVVYTIFKYISLIYILYLSYRIAQSKPDTEAGENTFTYSKGFVLNMINPKAYIGNAALIAQFSQPGEQYLHSVSIIFLLIISIVPFTNVLWILAGKQIAALFKSEEAGRVVQLSFAGLLSVSVIYVMLFVD